MRSKRMLMTAAVAALAVLVSACTIDVERNSDMSLQIHAKMTADSLATEFERDPENDSVQISIDDGVMWVDVKGVDENGDYEANLRVELSVEGGDLAVDITEAFYNGWTVPDEIRTEFNEEIAAEIKKAATENPDATLVSLTADDGKIVTEWRVETQDSKNN